MSCDNHGMGNEARAAGNRVGLEVARGGGPYGLAPYDVDERCDCAWTPWPPV